MIDATGVVVAYSPGEEERKIYEAFLAGYARMVFLAGLAAQERIQALQEAEVIVTRSLAPSEIRREEISHIRRAKFIQLVFAGADNVPFAELPESVTVASNTGAFAEPLAEHVLAMALALAKSLVQKHQLLTRGAFDQSGLNQFLRGGVCGIVGLGGNGRAIAGIMKAMGMSVYGVNRRGVTDAPVDFIGTPDHLKKVLAASDVVVLAVPLTRETRGLIGRRELEWMKRDAILINVARGAVIDQKGLYDHLKANPSFRVGIDTWWSEPAAHGTFELDYPFFELPNLIGSPHIADHVPGMMPKATRRALQNVRAFLQGEEVRGILKRQDYIQ